MFLSTLGSSLLGNILVCRGINRAGEGHGQGIVRAGYGTNSRLKKEFFSPVFPGIVWANKYFALTQPILLQTLIFWHFLYYQSISPTFKENIKQVSRVKIPNLTILLKQYFACSV